MNNMPGLLVLYNLLARASSLPCSNGARAFLSLLTSEDDWLSLAFDGFIPALQNQNIQIPQRILAAYVLHALYVSHGHGTNPFYNHLLRIFESERKIAVVASSVKSSVTSPSQRIDLPHVGAGTQGGNEQLVWVLWKILRAEGDELAPYSPDLLSQTAVPESFRIAHLVMHEKIGSGNENRIATLQTPSTGLIHPKPGSLASPNLTVPFQSAYPPVSRSSYSPLNSAPEQTPLRRFSPFDEVPHSGSQQSLSGQMVDSNGRLQDTSTEFPSRQPHYQLNMPRELNRDPKLSAVSPSARSGTKPDQLLNISQTFGDQRNKVNGDGGRQASFRTIHEKSYMYDSLESRQGGALGIGNRSSENQNGVGGIRHEPKHVEHQSQLSNSAFTRPPVPTVPGLPQFSSLNHPGTTHSFTSESGLNGFQVASDTVNAVRQRPNPISRPQPHPLLQRNGTPYAGTSVSTLQLSPNNGVTPSLEAIRSDHKSSQETSMSANGNSQQTFGVPYSQQRRVPTPTRVPQPTRSPGVIGSGRPSSLVSGRNISVDNSTYNQSSDNLGRSSQMMPIGNDRMLLTSQSRDITGGPPNMIPFSMSRVRSPKGESAKTQLGAIGKPHSGLGDNKSQGVNEPLGLVEELATLDIGQKQKQSSRKIDTAPIYNTLQSPDSALPHKRDVAENAAVPLPPAVLQSQEHLLHRVPPSEIQRISVLAPVADDSIKNEAIFVTAPPPSTSGSSSAPLAEPAQPTESHERSRLSPARASEDEGSSEVYIDEREHNKLAHAIILLLCARERVLTLSEQRMLHPHLSALTQPLSLLRPVDLPPLVTNNPDIAAKLLVLLLDRREEDAANIEQLLSELSTSDLTLKDAPLHGVDASSYTNSMPAFDALQTVVRFVTTYGASTDATGSYAVSPFGGREAKEGYLDALRKLPPTRQSFNLIARLLNPTRTGASSIADQEDSPEVRVATLVRIEVLGGFVSACVGWIERAEQQAREGEVHDDRVAVAASNLCRFYSSLLKHGFVSAASETDTAEIMRFALQFSRFEEARSLYSTLVAART